MKRKNWSLKEKLEILAKVSEGDVVSVCRTYGVSTGTYYFWKKRFETRGEAGLKMRSENSSKELKELEEQNRVLRKLLAEKEIELEIQRELVKKKFGIDIQKKK